MPIVDKTMKGSYGYDSLDSPCLPILTLMLTSLAMTNGFLIHYGTIELQAILKPH